MVEETLAELALTGGTTVVAAMATDAWRYAHDGFVRLFRREGQDRQEDAQAQLESNNALVEGSGDPGSVRLALTQVWQARLAGLLTRHPEAEPELLALLDGLEDEVRDGRQVIVQMIQARDGSAAYGAAFGNVNVYGGTPGSLPPPAPWRPPGTAAAGREEAR